MTDTASSLCLPAVASWYAGNGRHGLPWRLTRDPYAVLVSEVMLQQTQVSRVVSAYEAWLARWPTPLDLAKASGADVLRAWSGLGYNRRALNLHRAAIRVVDAGQGHFPVDPIVLGTFPGIGRYTASAVASFAGAVPVPVVDTNIGRVLGRYSFGAASARDLRPSVLWGAAGEALPREGEAARSHNLALMDLGALVCRPAAPGCQECPLSSGCRWLAAGAPPTSRPLRPTPKFETTDRFARGRIVHVLREAPLTVEGISMALPPTHAARVHNLLSALERDGLVVMGPDGRYALPGDVQGSKSIASPKL